MKNNYLIDGYNLGFKDRSIADWLHKGNTEQAIDLIIRRVRQGIGKAGQIIVVFDGKKFSGTGGPAYSGIRVVFSRKPQSADDIIREKLRSLPNASDWIVVSSDHEIINTARDMGAQIVQSEKFLKSSLKKTSVKNTMGTPDKYNPQNVNVDYWLEQFKNGEEE